MKVELSIEQLLYEKLCRGCMCEKKCHDKKEVCQNYLEELDKEINEEDD